MIGAYVIIGIGVAIGLHVVLSEQIPAQWKGYTITVGIAFIGLFWPVAIVTLLTLILCRLADR